MSFGVSIGDVIQTGTLCWGLYRSCRDSSTEFQRISHEVASLHAVLHETEEFLEECNGLSPTREQRLGVLVEGVKSVLQDLTSLLDNYESLGTQAQRAWDRVRWGLEDLAELRSRIISSTTLLTAFNSQLASSSTARIEKKLNKFIAEVQSGLREGSVVMASNVAETIETPDIWVQLRRELEDVGISEAVVQENQASITQWFKRAITDGMLEEITSSNCVSPRLAVPGSTDSGYGGSLVSSTQGSSYAPTLVSVSAANSEFENELKQHPSRVELVEKSSVPIVQQPVKVRKASTISSVFFKLLGKDNAIIEAASDGDIAKVSKLITAGANVNARDRWGWSALSMCGYGGYADVGRILLEHGAEIDNVDVDGDTPESLALNRGHAAFVILLDEERKRRDARTREEDKEVPRPISQVMSK